MLFVSTDGFRPNTGKAVHAFCHSVPQVWHQMGVILSATDTLNWLARMTGQDPARLTAGVDPARPAKAPVTFLPYLSGERTPHNNAGARGALVGLSQATEVSDLARAAMEGVAYAFVDSLDALKAAGTTVGDVYAIGGGARSEAWVQMIADACDMALHVPSDGDFGGAFGAARLGFTASEGAEPLEYLTPAPIRKTITPNAAMARYHAESLARYRALYPGTHML